MGKILKCPKCNNYTLNDKCIKCKVKTIDVRPPRFSLEDKYGVYRRRLKRELN